MLASLTTLAQDYSYNTVTYSPTSTESIPTGLIVGYWIFVLVFSVIIIAGVWKIFTKARQPGWASLVPFYNTLVLLKIVGRPWWWFLLMLIPFANIVFAVIVYNDLSKSFGKGVGTTILMLLLPFIGLPMLGFGKAQYLGPSAPGSAGNGMNGMPPAGPAPMGPNGPVGPSGPVVPPTSPMPPVTPQAPGV